MLSTLIQKIHAREILDSRGLPTVEVDIILRSGAFGRASVPSGASTGENEALELRDSQTSIKNTNILETDVKSRYQGKGVLKAVYNINHAIAPALIGLDASQQSFIDKTLIELDGTHNKHILGANSILAVSLATAKAAAAHYNLPLYRYLGGAQAKLMPLPFINILNAGAHSDAPIDIQEFMIIPKAAPTFAKALQMGSEVFYALKKLLQSKKLSTAVGDEGGFAPFIKSHIEALDFILQAIQDAGYKAGKDIHLALDVAASEFYTPEKKSYIFKKSSLAEYSSADMIVFYKELLSKYPIVSLEDPFDQNDWEAWSNFTKSSGQTAQIVGDDLFVTNSEFLKQGIEMGAANSILIKLNQIGTVTETLDTIRLAHKNSYKTIISHRSGETEDTFLADLAVATNAGQIKTGSISRTDRVCKYNQLLRIEESLGSAAIYSE